MAKTAKKKSKSAKKSARVVARPKAAVKSAKTKKPVRKKAAPRKIDPLNRNNYRAITPMLSVTDVRRAVDFYTNALGFTVKQIMDTPYGVLHAEITFRDATVMLSPEEPKQNSLSARSIGNTPVTLYLLVTDVDQVFAKAVDAGGSVLMPVADAFWGDRIGMIADPDGNKWMIATHKSEPTEAEMVEAMRQWEQQQPQAAAAAAGGR